MNNDYLVGYIPDIDVPSGWNEDEEHDIIVNSDGSVVFGVAITIEQLQLTMGK
jgi:hypothetical protein